MKLACALAKLGPELLLCRGARQSSLPTSAEQGCQRASMGLSNFAVSLDSWCSLWTTSVLFVQRVGSGIPCEYGYGDHRMHPLKVQSPALGETDAKPLPVARGMSGPVSGLPVKDDLDEAMACSEASPTLTRMASQQPWLQRTPRPLPVTSPSYVLESANC